jgi:hypothetical protein
MWMRLSNVFELKDLSGQEWLIFLAVNVAFYLFMITIAPRLRAFLRQWRRAEDRVAKRFSDYYGALGGPAIVPRNVVPELCVAIYCYFGGICMWIFQSPLIGVIWFILAGVTLTLWRGVPAVAKLAKWAAARHDSQRDTTHLAVTKDEMSATPSDLSS